MGRSARLAAAAVACASIVGCGTSGPGTFGHSSGARRGNRPIRRAEKGRPVTTELTPGGLVRVTGAPASAGHDAPVHVPYQLPVGGGRHSGRTARVVRKRRTKLATQGQ